MFRLPLHSKKVADFYPSGDFSVQNFNVLPGSPASPHFPNRRAIGELEGSNWIVGLHTSQNSDREIINKQEELINDQLNLTEGTIPSQQELLPR